MKRMLIVLAVSLGFIVSALPSAWGGYLDVCPSGCSYAKIQDAINASAAGDTIRVAQGVYYENISITTSKDFTLEGGWDSAFTARGSDASLTVIDGQRAGKVFHIAGVADLNASINGFTITNGSAAQGAGLLVYITSPSQVNLSFTNNTFTKNIARDGGGVSIIGGGSNGSITIDGNTIINNKAGLPPYDCSYGTSGPGGGIYVSGLSTSASLKISNNLIKGNYGGGIFLEGGKASQIERNKIIENVACGWSGWGGGIATDGATFDIKYNIIQRNRANTGGGIGIVYLTPGASSIEYNLIEGNTSTTYSQGGGLLIDGAVVEGERSLTVSKNAILKNTGGGVYLTGFAAQGNYTFDRNIIVKNTVADTTYSSAFYHRFFDSSPKVTNNTIVCNDGGGFFDDSSSPQPSIINTILWNNSWYGSYQNLISVNPSSITYSDIGPPDYDNYKSKGYHNLSVDPLFVDPENGDFRLQKCSRLIDRGDSAILDPDGSRSDIGAIPYGLIDSDGDGIPDINDNCPAIFNPDQEDLNNNGIGDVCEALGCK